MCLSKTTERILVLALLFSFVYPTSYAQNANAADSLLALLNTKLNDTTRINVLNQLGTIYSDLDSAKTQLYSNEAIDISQSIGYTKGEVDAIINLAGSKTVVGKYVSSIELLQEAYTKALMTEYNQGMITALNDLGVSYHYVGEVDSTIRYFKESLKLRYEVGDDLEIARGLSNLGAIYQYKGIYDTSITYFQRAFEIMEDKGSPQDRAIVIGNVGNIEYEKGNLEQALVAFQQALLLLEETGITREIARLNSNIGIVYSDMGLYTKSLEHQLKALDLYTQVQDEQGTANCYHELSNLAIRQEEYEEALAHITKAIEIRERVGYLKGLSESYMNASEIAKSLGSIGDAESYIVQAIEILKKIKDSRNLSASNISLAEIYLSTDDSKSAAKALFTADSLLTLLGDQVLRSELDLAYSNYYLAANDYKRAIRSAESAKTNARQAKFPTVLRDAASVLAKNYAALGNYKPAFENQQLYKQMDDSLINVENSKRIARIESQYEFEKREEELREAQIRKEQILQARNQKNLIVSASVGSIVLLITGFIYFQYRQRAKYATLVEQKNTLLSETMASKEKLFSVIAHDLKSPLSAFTSMSATLAENIDAFQKDQIVTFLRKFEKSSQNLSELLNNLLQWSLSQTGSLSVHTEEFDVRKSMENGVKPLVDFAESKGINLSIEGESLKAKGDVKMVETVIRNLVSNALKFSENGGEVSVQSTLEGDKILVSIQDSGVGMDKDEVDKLFDLAYDPAMIGDHEEKGTGLGLFLSKELVEKNQGIIGVESKKDEGSRFYFTLPKAA